MKLYELSELIETVCPIFGINSDGVIWFKSDATLEQQEQAQLLMELHKDSIT